MGGRGRGEDGQRERRRDGRRGYERLAERGVNERWSRRKITGEFKRLGAEKDDVVWHQCLTSHH